MYSTLSNQKREIFINTFSNNVSHYLVSNDRGSSTRNKKVTKVIQSVKVVSVYSENVTDEEVDSDFRCF